MRSGDGEEEHEDLSTPRSRFMAGGVRTQTHPQAYLIQAHPLCNPIASVGAIPPGSR